MNRWLRRRSVRVLLILLGLFVVASIAVRIFFPAERMKQLALDQIESRTGMIAQAGPASVQFPWPLGLSVKDLSLEDPDGDAAYESLKLTAGSILIQADLMSILRRSPEITQIRLDEPHLVLVLREAEARPEAGDETPGTEEETVEGQAPADFTAVLSVLQIEDGEVDLTLVDGRAVRVSGIRQRAGVRVEQGRAKGQASGGVASVAVSGEKPLELPGFEFALSFDASMDPAKPEGAIELESAEMGGARVHGRVRFAAVDAGTELVASLDADAELVNLFALAKQQAPLPAPYDEKLELLGGTLRAHLEFDGVVPKEEPDPETLAQAMRLEATIGDARAKLSQLEFRVEEAKLEREGAGWAVHARGIHGPGMAMTADAQLPLLGEGQLKARFEGSADLAQLRRRASEFIELMPAEGREGLPPESEWPGVGGMMAFQGDVTAPMPAPEDPEEIALEVRLTPRKLALLPPAWNDSLRVASGNIVLHASDAQFTQVALTGPGLAGSANGSAWGWPETTEVEADLEFTELDLDRLKEASTPKTETAWRLPALVPEARAAKEPEAFVPPANLAAELRMRASSVKSNGYVLRDMSARASMREQKLSIPAASAKLGDGTVESAVEVDWTKEPPTFDAKSSAKEVPASELLRPFAGPLADALTTRFSGEIDLLGPVLEEPEALKQAISGVSELRSNGGVLKTEPILGTSLSSFLGKHYDKIQTLDFRSMTAGLRIDSGQVHFDKMLLDGNTRVSAAGAVGLDGRCDYRLDFLLPTGATPELGDLAPVADLLRDDNGRIGFAVAVTGPAKQPKVQVDWEALAKRARDKGAQQLEDDLKKKAKSALEGLLGGKKGGG